jgi:hypothetical protein
MLLLQLSAVQQYNSRGAYLNAMAPVILHQELERLAVNVVLRRFVQTSFGAAADKPAGVVALTCFDLRRFGKVKHSSGAVAVNPKSQQQPDQTVCMV